jgi:hypothetical protein
MMAGLWRKNTIKQDVNFNAVFSKRDQRGKVFDTPNWPYKPNMDSIALMDLKPTQCRFPLAGGLYCGHGTEAGRSYCPEHHKLCYVAGSGKKS